MLIYDGNNIGHLLDIERKKNTMERHKERLELTDSIQSAIVKMCDGNPGALRVLCESIKINEKIDPDCAFGPYGVLISLDSFGIYGSNIWLLYKDVCGENLVHMIAVLRAMQLGITSEAIVKSAMNNRGQGLDVEDLVKQVKEKLPKFNIESVEQV